jgi:hypothetical protein
MAIVVAVAGLMLSAGLQPAFAHGRTTITLDGPPVQGKQVRVVLGHSNEPAYGFVQGIHNGLHSLEVSLADEATRLPLAGAQLKVDKYYFNDIGSFNAAASVEDADVKHKGVTLGGVFGNPGFYQSRQLVSEGIYGYRIYGTINYFGVAQAPIDATFFCASPEGDTAKFNSAGWAGSYGCIEDIRSFAFPAIPEGNEGQKAKISVTALGPEGQVLSMNAKILLANQVVKEGYTPFEFEGKVGETYKVSVSDFEGSVFDHWDNDSTSPDRTITLAAGGATLTAHYVTESAIEAGVLLYTHGNMVNAPGTPEMNRLTAMDGIVETQHQVPSEIVFHMPYNWDQGLVKLDAEDVKYAVFMYTDLFGPNSTVIHNVTRGVFGGIDEYNYCPGVPMPDGSCMYMGQTTKPATTVSNTTLVFAEPARPDHPILREIFVQQAQAVSTHPHNEVLVLVGHGAKSDANDMEQEAELARAAAYAESKMGFADSAAVTAREDWPTLSPAAVQKAVDRIQAMLNSTGATQVVLVPATGSGSGFTMVSNALSAEGISFTVAPGALPIGQEEYVSWAEQVAKETLDFIKETQPTESTITPYWARTYD